MTQPPLSVDPDAVESGGNNFLAEANNLPAPPAPFMPSGSDPLSLRIIAEVPLAEEPITAGLPAVKAEAAKTASDVVTAAGMYRDTDQAAGEEISRRFDPACARHSQDAAGAQTGQMSQMTGMPMQMAQQAAQLPMQLMGMAAALPQAVMQGAQQAIQQFSGLTGQVDEDAVSKSQLAEPKVELSSEEKTTGADEPQSASKAIGEERANGATSGQPGAERAPQADDPHRAADVPDNPPPAPHSAAPTRPAGSERGLNL